MTIPDLHLAAEAVAAYVDGELATVPEHRAQAHLAVCAECRRSVVLQRHAKRVLLAAGEPAPSSDLLAKLRGIPLTADIGSPDIVLAVEGSNLVWGTGDAARRAGDDAGRAHRAWSLPHPHRGPRTQRLSRGLVGAAAGIAVGMLASFSPAPASAGAGPAGGSSAVAPGGSSSVSEVDTTRIGSMPNRPLRMPTAPDVMSASFVGQR
jgi:hypothetical protein